MFASLKQGIRFARQQNSMEALILLAFCMTALAMPMRTFIPVFVKDIFHRGPETYGTRCSDGAGIDFRIVEYRQRGQLQAKRFGCARCADNPGRVHLCVCSINLRG